MALENDGVIAKALNALFPPKRYAPDEYYDDGCPTPPEGWDQDHNDSSDQ